VQLPSTNGPVRRIEAERNVVISSPSEQSRATADRAFYDEASGRVELTGGTDQQPVWQGPDRLVRGDLLSFDRTNRVFVADRNAFLRVPVSGLAGSRAVAADPNVQRGAAGATNQFVEVNAARIEYRTNGVEFAGPVRARLLEDEVKRGEVDADRLSLRLGQRLEAARAEGNVCVRQFPATAPDRKVVKELRADSLDLRMTPEGRIGSFVADGAVQVDQTETRPGRPMEHFQLKTRTITAEFRPDTNALAQVVAGPGVVLKQGERSARGEQAVYNAAARVIELTGRPTATMPEGRISEAQALIWDTARQQLRVKGQFKSEWQREKLGDATRQSNLPGAKSP
jgi:lipopolysaccharide export system protein LptA